MKTVIHWKNTFKSFGLVLLVALIFGLICVGIDASVLFSTFGGFIIGMVTMMFSLTRWDCWHFE